jgi:hypothetical protein
MNWESIDAYKKWIRQKTALMDIKENKEATEKLEASN